MKHRVLSLFSGCGGLDQGFRDAGFEIGAAYDVDASALRSYDRNLRASSSWGAPKTRVHLADLSKISPKEIICDWIANEDAPPAGVVGGPPCQAFSLSNVNKRPDDPRIKLVSHYGTI